MIRCLYLYRPITPDEAAAASAWAGALGNDHLTISYRPSPVAMRVLMFDSVNEKGKRRQTKVRLLDDPCVCTVSSLHEAMETGDVVFNVYTGREDDRSTAWSGTDAVFTVAFPEGEACAWFARLAGGVAPGIAASCIWEANRFARDPANVLFPITESARRLFFKRRPANIREHEERVMCFAMDRLDEVDIGRVETPTWPSL